MRPACGHVMCMDCLHTIKESSGQCPMCRAHITSHQVAEDILRQCETFEEHCTVHEDVNAVRTCIDCMLLMCTECSEAHSNHSTCDIAEARSQMEARISPLAAAKVYNIKSTHGSTKRRLRHQFKWTYSSITELGDRLKDSIDHFIRNTLEDVETNYYEAKETIADKEQPTIDHFSPSGWPKELVDFAAFGQKLQSTGPGYNISMPPPFMDVSSLRELNAALTLKMEAFRLDIPKFTDTAENHQNNSPEMNDAAEMNEDSADDVTSDSDFDSDDDWTEDALDESSDDNDTNVGDDSANADDAAENNFCPE